MVRFPGILIRLGRPAARGMPGSDARAALQVMPGGDPATAAQPGAAGTRPGGERGQGTEPPAAGGGKELLRDTGRPGHRSDAVIIFACSHRVQRRPQGYVRLLPPRREDLSSLYGKLFISSVQCSAGL